MNMDQSTYIQLANAHAPKSKMTVNCLKAFLIGGGICVLAQALNTLWIVRAGLDREAAGNLTCIILVALTAFLTGLGVFDRIARFAGAGTLVPITGFANAVASQAIDSRSEGWILGVGAKIFTVAGPVLLYGTLAGVVWGIIDWLILL